MAASILAWLFSTVGVLLFAFGVVGLIEFRKMDDASADICIFVCGLVLVIGALLAALGGLFFWAGA